MSRRTKKTYTETKNFIEFHLIQNSTVNDQVKDYYPELSALSNQSDEFVVLLCKDTWKEKIQNKQSILRFLVHGY